MTEIMSPAKDFLKGAYDQAKSDIKEAKDSVSDHVLHAYAHRKPRSGFQRVRCFNSPCECGTWTTAEGKEVMCIRCMQSYAFFRRLYDYMQVVFVTLSNHAEPLFAGKTCGI